MKHCHYHPLKAATSYCPECESYQCKACTNEGQYPGKDVPRCFICHSELESQGGGYAAVPFWRRLQEAFQYPLSLGSMIVIALCTVIAVFAEVLPFLLIFSAVIITKYSFACLEKTAAGSFTPPSANEATGGGLVLVVQLLVIVIIGFGFVGLVGHFAGEALSIFALCFVIAALPASFMVLAVEKSLAQALNPITLTGIMVRIGSAYLVMLLILFVMMGSMEALSLLIGDRFATLGVAMESIISNYYSIVMFHIMGYVIYQKQHALGFIAEGDSLDAMERSEEERFLAHMSVLLKDGEFEEVMEAYHNRLKKPGNHPELAEHFFKLIIGLKAPQPIRGFADTYLKLLIDTDQAFKLKTAYQSILNVVPDYMPVTPKVRLALAGLYEEHGDFKGAARLLANFHKNCQQDELTIKAYKLMIEVLAHLPNTEKQRSQYTAFVAQLEKKLAEARAKITPQDKPDPDDPHVIEFKL